MLTEQKLKAFEESSAASEADGEQWVGIHIDDLAQLVAAARVANALDRWQRTDTLPAWRALEAAHRIYTAHGPAEVAK